MLKRMTMLVATAMMALPMIAFAGEAAKTKAPAADKGITVTGEVIDTVCYLSKGAHGAAHKDCAQACLKQGLPASLLSKGVLYTLLAEHGSEAVMEQVKAKGGETVTLTGKEVKKDGLTALFVTAVK